MSNFAKSAEDIKALANKFKSIIALADQLEKVGSVEQAMSESLARKEKANAEERNALLSLEETKKSLAAAEEMISNAQAKAVQIENAAHEKAEAFYQGCKMKGEELVKEYFDKKKKLQDEIIKLSNELSLASSELNNEKQKIKEAQDQFAKIKQQIAGVLRI